MARTVKIAKYIQVPGPGGFLRPTPRRNGGKPPALYLLQLRASAHTQFSPRRLTITISAPAAADTLPEPIKIKHS